MVYLAPESLGELFAMGSTSRAACLPALAEFVRDSLNGRFLNWYFWTALDVPRARSEGAFAPCDRSLSVSERPGHAPTRQIRHSAGQIRHR